MRFTKEKPEIDDTRIVIKFLWRPLTLNDETRMFEIAHIRQQYDFVDCGGHDYDKAWLNIDWID